MQRVRLKDIAEKTGYTINTISRALNNKLDINENTKKHILQVAKELGYRPNKVARSLRLNKTKTIGVIVTDVANPFFATIIKYIEQECQRRNYSIILRDSDENQKNEEEAINLLVSEQVDGIILVPVQKSTSSILRLQELRIPFVLVGRFFENMDCDFVVTNDEEGGFIATEYLIKKGHRQIACINGPTYISSARERFKGYYRAMNAYGIPVQKDLLRENVISLEGGYQACKELLNNKILPSAIFAYSDYVAAGIIRALYENGKRPGVDVSLIGYDDIDYSLCFEKPLTTIHIPKKELAIRSVDILCSKMEAKESLPIVQEKIKVFLVERETVGVVK